jgi:hypothetical protein
VSARCAVHVARRPCGLVCRGGSSPESQRACASSAGESRRATARERLPSYRELAGLNPRVACDANCLGLLHSRAPIRLLPIRAPRQAVLRTSSWLASALPTGPCGPPGEANARCVQPTSATQSNCVHPHLVCSQILSPLSQRGRPMESKAPWCLLGNRMFHDIRERFGGSSFPAQNSHHRDLAALGDERGRFLPTAWMRPSL